MDNYENDYYMEPDESCSRSICELKSLVEIVDPPHVKKDIHGLVDDVCVSLGLIVCPIASRGRPIEFGVKFSDNDEVKKLNHTYRHKNRPTNVLSFPMEEDSWEEIGAPFYAGDIILAKGVVEQESVDQNKMVDDHVCHLLTHGVLHLFGFDHIDSAESSVMEDIEIRVLASMDIKNPYLED